MTTSAGLLLSLLAPLAQGAEPPPVERLAFVGATVIPMDSERRLPDHTVLVDEGRILTVGPRDEVPVPERTRVIDAAGLFLMPGLVDMHVHHWAETEQTLFLANGVTTVRNMFGSPLHLAWRAQIEAGTRLGPTIVSAGPIVDGDPPVWPGSLVVLDEEAAFAAVQAHVDAGYDFVKVYSRLSSVAYEAIVGAAQDAGLPVDGHVPVAVGLDGALAAGQRTIEHFTTCGLEVADDAYLEGVGFEVAMQSELEAWRHVDEQRLQALAERLRESGVWSCPTLIVLQKWIPAESVEAELALPYMRYVSPMVEGMWRGMNARVSPEMSQAARAGMPGRMRLVRALDEVGARLVLGTDMGNPFVVAGYSLHQELANLVQAGLSPYAALRAGTRSAAECLGQERELGTLAPGLRADLLLLEADPLLDVAHAQRIVGVVARGRWLERAWLDERLAAIARPAPSAEPEQDR